ncbi:GNAT family N-acetyltransferase [Oceanobacillus kapialis]|uniref:GNAT family N-acetyltransferase n=1 Tax=Oceanobacillus kapialis TaxID=481353 RepID=A0ABW5Q364_9BACI
MGGENIRLQFFETSNRISLQSYYLSEEQLSYTAHPVEALKKCEEEPNRHPVGVFAGLDLVGFFVLQPYTNNPNAILLRAYSIQMAYQGKGIARTSLKLLPTFITESFYTVEEIILAVNHENNIAQQLYKKAGFEDTGRRVFGRSGEQYIYTMCIR